MSADHLHQIEICLASGAPIPEHLARFLASALRDWRHGEGLEHALLGPDTADQRDRWLRAAAATLDLPAESSRWALAGALSTAIRKTPAASRTPTGIALSVARTLGGGRLPATQRRLFEILGGD